VLTFVGAVALATAIDWPERLASMCRNLAEGEGAFFLFGVGCMLVFASAIWTTFLPKQSAPVLAWSPLIAVIGVATASVWWPPAPADPSVGSIGTAGIIEAVKVSAAGGMAVVFASILSSFAAIAFARRARRVAAP